MAGWALGNGTTWGLESPFAGVSARGTVRTGRRDSAIDDAVRRGADRLDLPPTTSYNGGTLATGSGSSAGGLGAALGRAANTHFTNYGIQRNFDAQVAANAGLQLSDYAMSPDAVFSNLYEGLKAYSDVGYESQQRAAQQLADLEKRLRGNQFGLQGDLSGVERAQMYSMLGLDKKLYGTNSAEINRMQRNLLLMLAETNKQRQEQTRYYSDQKPFIQKALEQALHQSQLDRREGKETLGFNLRRIGSEAASRGAWMSPGRLWSDQEQQANYNDLLRDLAARDDRSRLDKDKAMREVASALEKIRLAQSAAEQQWREQNAGLQSDRERLDIGYERGNWNFMHGIHALNLKDEARAREEALRNQIAQAQLNAARAQEQAARQQANQAAFMQAAQAASQARQQQLAFFGQMTPAQLDLVAAQAFRQGNVNALNMIKEVKDQRGAVRVAHLPAWVGFGR